MNEKSKQFLSTFFMSMFFVLIWHIIFEKFFYPKNELKNIKQITGNIKIENQELKKTDKTIQIKSIENDKIKIDINVQNASIVGINLKEDKFFKINKLEKDAILLKEDESISFHNKSNNLNNTIFACKLMNHEKTSIELNCNDNLKNKIKIYIKDDYLLAYDISQDQKNIDTLSYLKLSKLKTKNHDNIIYNNNKISSKLSTKISSDEMQQDSSDNSWLSFTTKYYLLSIINQAKGFISEKAFNNSYSISSVSNENNANYSFLIFAGPKSHQILKSYNKKYNINKFEKNIDFGFFYFLVEPFLVIMNRLYKIFGNYTIAIILLTVLVKILFIPISNKSYIAMNKIKKLNPKMDEIKEKYKDNKQQLNIEIMNLYRKENINPFSTIIPILFQIPIFFALYNLFTIPIELKGAYGFFWIKDLSLPDPISIFNLFGLLNFNPPSFLNIGILPIIMGITMFLQQKISSDANQSDSSGIINSSEYAKMMKWMPLFFIFIFSSFPAGLIIYWIVNNIFTILNQILFNKFNK